MPDCHLEADAVASSVATIEGIVAQMNELAIQLNAESALLSDRMAILEACLNSGMAMTQRADAPEYRVHPVVQKVRSRMPGCWNKAALVQAKLKQFIEKMLAI